MTRALLDRTRAGAPDLRLELRASAAEVRRVRRGLVELAQAAGLGEEALGEMLVAVSEGCVNVAEHAYDDGDPGARMTVEAWLAGDGIVVLVADGGEGSAGLRDDLPDGRGKGLRYIAAVCDDWALDSPPGEGTRLWMSFASGRGRQA